KMVRMRATVMVLPALLAGATGCLHMGPGDDPDPRFPSAEQGAAVAPPAAPATAAAAGQTETQGVAAGVPYIERTTGGATLGDKLPMIVALHSRGGTQDQFGRLFANFPVRARIILPHGPYMDQRGHYRWWNIPARQSTPQEFADEVRPAEGLVAAAIAELQKTRPTIGRPIVCGFSQGGTLSWSLAVLNPELVSHAFPFAGSLPVGFSPGTWSSPFRPRVHAFHGVSDGGNAKAHNSVDELHRMGIEAEIRDYPIGHTIDPTEARDALAMIAAVASRPDQL
ncbi:MAG TPA: hypothetical protein VHB21_25670, partial [Minicystis sp.]|nr:hypothetical protein [Minicystis sp.]